MGYLVLESTRDLVQCKKNYSSLKMEEQLIKESPEEIVSRFYNTVGWETTEEITEDAKRWEDLREFSREYVSKCRLRVLRHIPEQGMNILDMASGPIQYKEYLEYSKNFKKRYCVDLSLAALEMAKKKISDHGVFLHGSFFNISLEENFFDCAISLHTIYHIDREKQEEAVRKLLYVTKPGKPVIIVYGNPNTLMVSLPFRLFKKIKIFFLKLLTFPFRVLRWGYRYLRKSTPEGVKEESFDLYYYLHPLEWWNRFDEKAVIKILPWRSLGSDDQKRLIPNNKIGKKMLDILFKLEDRYPVFFVNHFQYPMIILTKKD
jgi:ubiquinone/menaquinone biosynthesis C-methylase UbiE